MKGCWGSSEAIRSDSKPLHREIALMEQAYGFAKIGQKWFSANVLLLPKTVNRPSATMTSLAALRIQRHAQWLRNLSFSLHQLVLSSAERPEQI